MENEEEICEMDMVFKFEKMVLNMKGIEKTIKLMVKVNSGMLMVTFLKVIIEIWGKKLFNIIFKIAGEWKNDKANGYGVYKHVNGARYEGYWKNDL